MVFFLVCSATYTGCTDPDCNLDCVVDGVVVASGGGQWWWWRWRWLPCETCVGGGGIIYMNT